MAPSGARLALARCADRLNRMAPILPSGPPAPLGSEASPLPDTAWLNDLSPDTYQRHGLHSDERIWPEKNCYMDVWIALVHTLGLQPLAMLGVTASIDFLGDQWTFVKPSHDGLRRLYGIEVQELTLWRPLAAHVLDHLAAGRLISVEADAFWLPDTAATDYRRNHSKTTVMIVGCDAQAEQLSYFHNAGLYRLDGEDYRQTMANGGLAMPLLAEWVDTRRRLHQPEALLQRLARQRLIEQLAWWPDGSVADNPVRRFQQHCTNEMPALVAQDLQAYHAWAFANTRQFGAAMEMLALHLRWLGGHEAAAAGFEQASMASKTLILKAARSVAASRPLAADALFDAMTDGWAQGHAQLRAGLTFSATRP